MKERVDQAIQRLVLDLHQHQASDGSFRFCFENSPITDAGMIILIKSLGQKDERVIPLLVERLKNLQDPSGCWKVFRDEKEGNLSATIQAYYALLYSGYCSKDDPHMKLAKKYIIANGGLERAHSLTKILLAVTGQYQWPNLYHIPIHFALLPLNAPLSFHDFSSYARVHMAPILLLSDARFSLTRKDTPDLSDLHVRVIHNQVPSEEERFFTSTITQSIKTLIGLPAQLHQLARKRLENYMLERIEHDGSLYSYFTSTFLMIYALLSLGYSKNHPVITKAVNGLKTFACQTERGTHIQNSPSQVWDTSLISYALQTAQVSSAQSMIIKAEHYITSKQHDKYGDWRWTSTALPGGWGFSDSNTIHPDVDDTTAALRAIRRRLTTEPHLQGTWKRGLGWLLAMQNDDGGWPAFERNKNKQILTYVPLDGAEDAAIDPSTADLTGRTLEFLGEDVKLTTQNSQVKRGVKWLEQHQERNGSWYGKWGVAYIYGTWAAVTGMRAVGVRASSPSIQKAVNWFKSIQNSDGGWGESCYSDSRKQYVALDKSTLSHTAWAIDVLLSVTKEETPEIRRGIECLLNKLDHPDWTYQYPTGAGLPGRFYIYYHSYNYIWPLVLLGKYRNQYL